MADHWCDMFVDGLCNWLVGRRTRQRTFPTSFQLDKSHGAFWAKSGAPLCSSKLREDMAKPSQKKARAPKGKAPLAPQEEPLVKHGWKLFAHPLLLDQIERLATGAAAKGAGSDPAKVLKWLTGAIFDEIPQNPTLAAYRQGDTLGSQNKHWFRDKYAGRFRLFFRYDSKAKIIVFAWVNDENTLRTRGAKNDAYAVFKGMLADGNPPNTWADLLKAASDPALVKRLKSLGS
jgi:toxin YhaV